MTQAARRFSGARSPALAAAVSAVLAGAAGTAAAQSTASLDEVIVTATKRSERLQDVPESISAFDTKAISMRGLQQMGDYAKLIPGMSISEREPGATTIVFRGVASSGLQFGAVSSAALYLDDQPITQSGRNPDPRLIDIERIEALRGPQGTLYGASSQSGTLRVITNKPDPNAFDSWAEAQVSNTSSGGTGYDVSAMLNIPLASDRLALRLVGFTAEDAGFIDNVLGDSLGTASPGNCPVVARLHECQCREEGRQQYDDQRRPGCLAMGCDGKRQCNARSDLPGRQRQRARRHQPRSRRSEPGPLREGKSGRQVVPGGTDDQCVPAIRRRDTDRFLLRPRFPLRGGCDRLRIPVQRQLRELRSVGILRLHIPVYDFGGDPRGFATNHESARITTIEARLASKADAESRWGWLVGAFYSQERGHTEFDSFIHDYQNTQSFIVLQRLRELSDRQSASADRTLVPRPLRYANSTRSPCSAS